MEEYLKNKTDFWLDSELDQAYSKAVDSQESWDRRIEALAAAAVLSEEINRRKCTKK